jgi:hypothetical protein
VRKKRPNTPPRDTHADLMATARQRAEVARQEREQALATERERFELVNATNRVQAIGEAYERDQQSDAPYLARWVKALGELHHALAQRDMLPRLDKPPAGVTGHALDAYRVAVSIMAMAHSEPAKAVSMLTDLATVPDFAMSVARWLRGGIMQAAEKARFIGEVAEAFVTKPTDAVRDTGTGEVADFLGKLVESAREAADAYLPASEIMDRWPDLFQTYDALKKHVKEHSMKTHKPSSQRLTVHAGDLLKSLRTKDTDTVNTPDLPDEEIQRRLEQAAKEKAAVMKGRTLD